MNINPIISAANVGYGQRESTLPSNEEVLEAMRVAVDLTAEKELTPHQIRTALRERHFNERVISLALRQLSLMRKPRAQ